MVLVLDIELIVARKLHDEEVGLLSLLPLVLVIIFSSQVDIFQAPCNCYKAALPSVLLFVPPPCPRRQWLQERTYRLLPLRSLWYTFRSLWSTSLLPWCHCW